MLTIHEVTSATDAKHYYAEADYYSQGQETVGRWGGRLASELGLRGTVDKNGFGRMCDNLHPETGRRLTARTNHVRRVGYDFTVSVPKSASVLRAFAGEQDAAALDAARDRAIAGMMAEIEADMQTRVRRGGVDADRTTGNMVWAAFHHTTSRPVDGQAPDMHEHTHMLVFNVTRDPVERRLKAGQFGNLKRDGEYYSAVFDALYTRELERLGFVIDRRGGKKWEVAGIPQAVIDRFRKRTDEIEDEAERRNITAPGRKAELGAKTRKKKQKELTPGQLREAWETQLTDGERDALAAVYGRETARGLEVTATEAVRYAIAHVSEKLSVAPEREFKRVALLHGLGTVTPETIAVELPRQGIIVRDIDGRAMATTEELQREEDFLAGFAARGQGQVCPAGVHEGLTRALADGKSLNDGQWEAVTGLLDSPNRVNLVEGPAGAGKSSMLSKFEEGLKRAGMSSTFLATTAKATEVLQNDGFADTKTVAHFLLDERMQNAASGGTVVVDETSMLGHKDAVRLLRIAHDKNLKLVFVGDPMQHGSVPRGAFMHVLKAYGRVKPFRLKEILRQKKADDVRYLEAATQLSEGRTLEGFDTLNGMGWVREMGDENRYRRMAADYLQAVGEGKSCLVVSPTHKEAALITREIRDQLRQAGKLDKTDREFTRLVAVDASEPERGLATTYRPGDVLQFHQNARGFRKGERVTVTDPASVPLAEAGKFSLYRPEKIALAAGDRIRFTGTVKTWDGEHTLRNGASHTVAEITPGGNIRLDNGWVVPAHAGHFRHGFVETSFGSQGSTVKRVILGMAADSLPATNAEQMYVSASRATERVTVYTDDIEAVRKAVQRSSQKVAALDLKARPEPARLRPKPRQWQRLRKHMERERRLAVLDRARAAWSASRTPWGPVTPGPPTHAGRIRQEERGQAYER